MFENRVAVILGSVGSCSDRYMPGGYGSPYRSDELLERVAQIRGFTEWSFAMAVTSLRRILTR